jgi:hypothetical protein
MMKQFEPLVDGALLRGPQFRLPPPARDACAVASRATAYLNQLAGRESDQTFGNRKAESLENRPTPLILWRKGGRFMAMNPTENLAGKTPRSRTSRLTAQQLETAVAKPQPALKHTSNRPTPTHEQIAARAYQLWIARGCGHGNDLGDWFEAERQLSQQ